MCRFLSPGLIVLIPQDLSASLLIVFSAVDCLYKKAIHQRGETHQF